MSYLVLARKWRPKNFQETVGQKHVLTALTNALDSERLHHAYLFAGTRGVGKTTIARILAKSLNCETGITSMPCGECSACAEIDEGRFVDLIEVDAASRTKVDDTRELLDNVQYAPARGRFKVYLIDEVHMLSKSSFNALLKTLEEPPPHVKFLLATTDPQKLPVTVLSRCLQFNLKRLTPALIAERLELICNAESIEFEAEALAIMARAADGSLRDALSLLDQAIAFCGGVVAEEGVGSMLGTIDRQHISRLIDLLADGDAAGLIAAIAEVDEQFPDYARLLDDLARVLQRIAVYQTVGVIDSEDDVDEAQLEALASRIAAEDVQLFYQIALLGRRDLQLAPDPRSGVEMTLLRMLTFQPEAAVTGQGSGGNVRKQAPRPQETAAPAAAAGQKTIPRSKPAPAAASAIWQDPDWSQLIGRLQLSGFNKQLASNCAYLRRDGDTVFLSLDGRSESYLTRARQAAMAEALSGHFGENLKVDISVGVVTEETPVQKDARRESENLDAARAGLEADPNIKTLKDMFGAEIVADSVEPINNNTANQE
ncbi:MAG: DNA polymerase III subunit gamma/tau [Woeseiaceae bacterium]